ncbi:MAG: TolC family protein [Bryobacterales bacterium]|nr:TolC family protein [Bryobacterales bacterium]
MKRLSAWLLPLALASSGIAQVSDKPTLDQLVAEALQNNLRLIAERYNIPVAEARIVQARLRPNPTLLLQAQYLDAFGLDFSLKNPAGPPEGDIGLLMPIVRGGKRAAKMGTAQWSKTVTEADFLNASRNLILDVQLAFVDFLLARENVQLLQSSQISIEQIVEVNKNRVVAGDVTPLELARSRLALLQHRNLLFVARRRFRQSQFRLQILAGRPNLSLDFDVTGSFRREEPVPLPGLQETALRNRPDLESARREVNRAQSGLRLQKAMAKPDWTTYSWVNRQWNIGIQNGMSLTFQWNIPLAVSDRNQGEIMRAEQEISQSETRVRASEREIKNELAAAYFNYQNALETVLLAENEAVKQALDVREEMHTVYRQGQEPLDVLLDVQKFYDEAVLSMNDSRAELARAPYTLSRP